MKVVFLSEYPIEAGAPFTGSHLQTYLVAKVASAICDALFVAFDPSKREYREGNLRILLLEPSKWEIVRLLRLLRVLLREKPKIVYTRGRSYHLIAGLITKLLYGSTLVWSVNAQEGYEEFKHLRNLFRSHRSALRKVLLMPLFFLLDVGVAVGMRVADVITVQNKTQLAGVRGKFPKKTVKLLPNVQEMPKVKVKSPLKGPYFVWVSARASATKRPENFIKLAEIVPEARFVMVGERRKGPENLVSFPRLPREQLHAIMREALALVVTSAPGSEGIPNVVIEAMLLGVPVVSVGDDFGFLNRGGGVVVEDLEAAAGVLRRLWSDRGYALKLSEEAREVAVSEFVNGARERWLRFWNHLRMETCSS